MPFCPCCRFEYRSGVRHCPDCGAVLVERLPPEPSRPPEAGPDAAAMGEAGVLLTVIAGEVHARLLQEALRAQGVVSRLQTGENPLLPSWLPGPVTASEQRAFALYVRSQDLTRARQIYTDLESPDRQTEESAASDEEGPEPEPFSLARYLRAIYGREIPRLLKDLRWLLFAVVVVDCAGTALGYRTVTDPNRLIHMPEYWPPPAWMYPFLGKVSTAPSWLGLFLHNWLVAVYYYVWGGLSFGALALYHVWLNAQMAGWRLAIGAMSAGAAAGSGIAGTAAGRLLPHGLLEIPAGWLAGALGLRAGLVWIRPLPGMRRWQSAVTVLHQFGLALFLVVPMLLLAAMLETEVNPWLYDRYIVGIGRAPGMGSEQKVGRASRFWQPAWSPDGTSFAIVNPSGHEVWTRKRGGEFLLVARDESKHFTSPTWSPDSLRVAALDASPGLARSELLIGRASEEGLREVTGGPAGRYLRAAWHPSDGRIGVLVEGKNAAGKPVPRNLWMADPALNVWEQVTHLPDGVMSQYGFSWSPDGRQIAFARQTAPRSDGTQLWVMDSGGGHPRRLTRGTRDAWPAWSPDSRWIAFLALPPAPEGREAGAADRAYTPLAHVCLIRADGTDRRDDLAAAEGCSSLSWSQDGRKLFYLRLSTMIAGAPKGL